MHPLIKEVEKSQLQKEKALRVGDTIKIYMEIIEGNKKRIQAFEGIIIKKRGEGINATVTLRKVTAGIGVEKVIPVHMPSIKKVEVVRRGKVRRAKLYYLRKLIGKSSKVQEDLDMVRTDKATRKRREKEATVKEAVEKVNDKKEKPEVKAKEKEQVKKA
jgi:large subunit ribosomal protein L19